jgi:RNA polymerase sigma factor FliA
MDRTPRTGSVHGDNGSAERERMILSLLPVVRGIAAGMWRRLPRAAVEFDDLVSAGMVGVIQALPRFDPRRAALGTFAGFRARGAMVDFVRETDAASRDLRRKAMRIEGAFRDLIQFLGRSPGDDEVAKALGVTLKVFTGWIRDLFRCGFVAEGRRVTASRNVHGLDGDRLIDRGPDPFWCISRREEMQIISSALCVLSAREYVILAMLYGADGMTQAQVAVSLRLDNSRICQINQCAMAKLRAEVCRRGQASGHPAGLRNGVRYG